MYQLLDLIIFVVTLVLHWGGRSFWTSWLQFDSGHFSGLHNLVKISWWVHMTFCCCPTQLSVSAACFIVFWMGRTTNGVDCSCMQYNLEVGRGRWYFWLAVVECSRMADTIYLFIQLCILHTKWTIHLSNVFVHFSVEIHCLAGFTILSNFLFFIFND
jgi:hypothetical protein